MLELGPHAAFIIWAYLGVVAGVAALIGYAVVDAHQVRGRLKELEARGVRRRSDKSS